MIKIIEGAKKELEGTAADTIASSIIELLKIKNEVSIAIPGGRSVAAIFQILKTKDVSWKNVHIFMVDERLVAIDDKESNFKLASDSFIAELLIQNKVPGENIHPFIFEPSLADYGIGNYALELFTSTKILDILLLSSGEDGHIGALYPNHHSIKDESDYFIVMNDSPKPPKDRMSASKKLLLKAQYSILLFFGKEKDEAFRRFNDNKIIINECPCKLVKDIKNSYVLKAT